MEELTRIVFLDRGTLPADIHLRPPDLAHELVTFDTTSPDQVADQLTENIELFWRGSPRNLGQRGTDLAT